MDALVQQFGGRGQQILEALFLHQAPDGGDPEGGLERPGLPVREALQLQAVAHQMEPGGRGREAAAQVAHVVLADGHGVVGLLELEPQVLVLDRFMEDIHRVRGEREGDAGNEGRQPGHGG